MCDSELCNFAFNSFVQLLLFVTMRLIYKIVASYMCQNIGTRERGEALLFCCLKLFTHSENEAAEMCKEKSEQEIRV